MGLGGVDMNLVVQLPVCWKVQLILSLLELLTGLRGDPLSSSRSRVRHRRTQAKSRLALRERSSNGFAGGRRRGAQARRDQGHGRGACAYC